jgi:hypothetical protein
MINLLDAMIYAVPAAMTLHLGIGLILKHPEWKRNGRTFTPPAPVIEPPAEPAPEIPAAPAQAAEMAEPVEVLVIPVPETEPEPDGLEELTTKKLRELARGRVPGFSKMTKATLIARIRELG